MKHNEVLNFWFNELTPKQWFAKSDELDETISTKFKEAHSAAILGELFSWRQSPEGRLAEIIVLDQFSRNIFRNKPGSFAQDPLALCLAQEAVATGAHKALPTNQRSFIYLPYMHSESLVIHDAFAELLADEPELTGTADFEGKHRVILERFGRYPHRNEILGRESTPEEIAFLTQPGSSF